MQKAVYVVSCDLGLECLDENGQMHNAVLGKQIQMPFVPAPDMDIIFALLPSETVTLTEEEIAQELEKTFVVKETEHFVSPIYRVYSVAYAEETNSILVRMQDSFDDLPHYFATIRGLVKDYGFELNGSSDDIVID